MQSIILYFNYVRFIKFIEIKKFLFENKDIYSDKNESYYPNSIFNIDSFPIALSLNIFVFKAFFGVFPKKITFFGNPIDFSFSTCFKYKIKEIEIYEGRKKFVIYIFFLIFPLTIAFIITAIFDILNDEKIKENYENIIYN